MSISYDIETSETQTTSLVSDAVIKRSKVKIAYFVNQYPMTSLTFIRREIAALESLGWEIQRYTIRRSTCQLVDRDDQREERQTRAILDAGLLRILSAVVSLASNSPIRFLNVIWAAWCFGLRSRTKFKHLCYFAEACLLHQWCRRDEIAHVHCHFGTNPTMVAMLCFRLGGPKYSFTVHGPEEFDRPESLALREKIDGASFVVGVSNFGCSQLFRWCPQSQWSKVKVVRCGLPKANFDLTPTRPNTASRFVSVGRLHEQKGTLLLLQAVALLAARGRQCEVTLVGDGPLRREVEDYIVRHELGSLVRLVGWQNSEELQQHLLESRALVLPSFAEGLPVAFMEALALGRPVISTYVAGIPELINRECGWLVPAGSVDLLADAMTEALDATSDQLAEMGRAGWKQVLQHHDLRVEAENLSRLLDQTTKTAHIASNHQRIGNKIEPLLIDGIPIFPLTDSETVELVKELVNKDCSAYFITANSHFAMLARRDPRLMKIANEAAFIVADGMPLVWAAKLSGEPLPGRVTGADLLPSLCEMAASEGFPVFLFGGANQVAQLAADRLVERFPNLQIAGVANPYVERLSTTEHAELVDQIRRSGARILFVGMGQPKGEYWIEDHYRFFPNMVSVQVGASFAFAAGEIPRAPEWLQCCGMEWSYRLYREPRRLVRRYLSNGIYVVQLLGRTVVRRILRFLKVSSS